jgi:hypothetical protein
MALGKLHTRRFFSFREKGRVKSGQLLSISQGDREDTLREENRREALEWKYIRRWKHANADKKQAGY